MKKKLLVFVVSLMFTTSLFSLPIQEASTAGENWLIGWNYRKSHEIYNATGAGTNYPIKIIGHYGEEEVSSSLVSTTTGSLGNMPLAEPWQHKIVHGLNVTWLFWGDGSQIVYAYSLDYGSSWSGKTTWDSFFPKGYMVSVATNGTYVHTVYSYCQYDYDLFYKGGELNSDGTINADSQQTVVAINGTTLTNDPVIAVDSSGYPWISYIERDNTSPYNYVGYAIKSSTKNGSWTTEAGFPKQIGETITIGSSEPAWTDLAPLTNDKMYASFWIEESHIARGNLWDGASWGSSEDITTSYTSHFCAMEAVGDDVYFTLAVANTFNVKSVIRTYGVGWGAEEDIVSGDSSYKTAPTLTLKGGDPYIFWLETQTYPSAKTRVKYRQYVIFGWATEQTFLEFDGQNLRGDRFTIIENATGLTTIPLAVTIGTSSPYSIWFAYGMGDYSSHVFFNQKCRTDFGDIRFTDDDGVTELDYWMEDKTDSYSATFWVEVADDLSSSNQTIYVYYGNSDVSTTSNGDNTFTFFDHFPYGTLDSTKWTEENSPTVTVSGSILTVESPDSSWRGVRSNNAYGPYNIAWRSRNQFTLSQYNKAGMQNQSNLLDDGLVFYWMTLDRETAKSANEGTQQTTDLTGDGNYHTFEITWVSGAVQFFIDEVSQGTHSTQVPDEALYVWIESQQTTQSSDWVSVRTFVSPEPSHGSWGSEEAYSPPPYLFHFYGLYNEDTGLLYDASSRAVNVTAYFITGENITQTFEVNGTYSFGTNYQPLYFKFDLVNPREYWVGEDETTAVIYIFNITTTVYTIDFIDLAGTLEDYPFITAKRYINGTAHTVEKRKVDVEKKIIMALKNGEKYTITIEDGTSYEYGDLLMTSETTITLTLKGIEFPQNIILSYRYVRLYAERHNNFSSISMLYQDLQTDTDNVVCNVKYRNGTVAYTTIQYTDTFNVTWTSASQGTTYFVEMDATHNEFGEINYRVTLYRSQLGTQPWDVTDILGSIPGIATADLIPTFIILCVAAVFSKVNAYVAAFMAFAIAAFLTWYGWISIPAGMLIGALFMAIFMGLVAKKARSGE